jgi:Zn-dependent protease
MNDWSTVLYSLFALIIAIPVHEYAHARSAVSYGDDTPERDGRLTIFPWTHFEPFGALFMIVSSIFGVGLGWGKPVRVRPENFRNPRFDDARCAAWGPLSNLLLAIGFALPLRFGWFAPQDPLNQIFWVCVLVNLGLMYFNLIPIYPLDGSHILRALLPTEMAIGYHQFMSRFGMWLLMLVLIRGKGLLELLVSGPTAQLARILTGG